MRVTSKEVAKKAGVSVATVSYVINNGPRPVTEATRQKVLNAIEELGYKPNRLARGLKTDKTQTLGIIIPDISDPFFTGFILGAEGTARERGYNVFLCNANRDPELELHYVNLLAQRQTDGLMIAGSRLLEDELEKATRNQETVILTPYKIPNAALFSIDDFDGGKQIGEYLCSLGHKEVRYIEGTWAKGAPYRYQGLISALEAEGVDTGKVRGPLVDPVTIEDGHIAIAELLKHDSEVTALVCYNDLLALGALQACADLGKRVPDDISIVGFDDIPEVSRSNPPLTTIRTDGHEIGTRMMNTLVDLIEEETSQLERIVLPVRLIKRVSCAPPSRG